MGKCVVYLIEDRWGSSVDSITDKFVELYRCFSTATIERVLYQNKREHIDDKSWARWAYGRMSVQIESKRKKIHPSKCCEKREKEIVKGLIRR